MLPSSQGSPGEPEEVGNLDQRQRKSLSRPLCLNGLILCWVGRGPSIQCLCESEVVGFALFGLSQASPSWLYLWANPWSYPSGVAGMELLRGCPLFPCQSRAVHKPRLRQVGEFMQCRSMHSVRRLAWREKWSCSSQCQ